MDRFEKELGDRPVFFVPLAEGIVGFRPSGLQISDTQPDKTSTSFAKRSYVTSVTVFMEQLDVKLIWVIIRHIMSIHIRKWMEFAGRNRSLKSSARSKK